MIYNLLYFQTVVQLCTTLTNLECYEIITKYSSPEIDIANCPESSSATTSSPPTTTTTTTTTTPPTSDSTSDGHISPDIDITEEDGAVGGAPASGTSPNASSTTTTTTTPPPSVSPPYFPNIPTSSRRTDGLILGCKNLGQAMAFVLNNTNRCRHLRRECLDEESTKKLDIKTMEQHLQKLCLPFLRVAALLRHHLYSHELPEIKTPQLEFVRLIYYLEIVTEGMDWKDFNGAKGLCFLPGTELTLPKFWCEQLMEVSPPTDTIRELLINQNVAWQQPRLLGLPREYERLFTVSV